MYGFCSTQNFKCITQKSGILPGIAISKMGYGYDRYYEKIWSLWHYFVTAWHSGSDSE